MNKSFINLKLSKIFKTSSRTIGSTSNNRPFLAKASSDPSEQEDKLRSNPRSIWLKDTWTVHAELIFKTGIPLETWADLIDYLNVIIDAYEGPVLFKPIFQLIYILCMTHLKAQGQVRGIYYEYKNVIDNRICFNHSFDGVHNQESDIKWEHSKGSGMTFKSIIFKCELKHTQRLGTQYRTLYKEYCSTDEKPPSLKKVLSQYPITFTYSESKECLFSEKLNLLHLHKSITMKPYTIFSLIIKLSYSSGMFNYPVQIISPWRPINPHFGICSSTFDLFQDVSLFKQPVTVKMPHKTHTQPVDGFTCHMFELITICKQSILFTIEESQILQNLEATEYACRDAINKWQQGVRPNPEHPPSICIWNSEHSEKRTYTSITPHNVLLNPYTMTYYDSIFLNGETSLRASPTINAGVLWIADTHTPIDCLEMITLHGVLLYSDSGLKNSFLWQSHVGSLPLEGSCQINLCGIQGLYWPNKVWLTVEIVEKDNIIFPSSQWKIPTCSEDTTININPNLLNHQTSTQSQLSSSLIECLRMLDKVRKSEKISLFELSFILPTAPGVGLVFKLSEDSFEAAHGIYQPIDLSRLNEEENLLGTDSKGVPVYINDWRGNQTRYYGINGITKVNRSIILPLLSILQASSIDYLFDQQSWVNIPHPIKEIVGNQNGLVDFKQTYNSIQIPILKTLETSNLLDRLKGYFTQFFHLSKIVKITVYGSIFILFLIILIKLKCH